MTRVFLIRHADVENPNRLFYGHLEGFPLSALGRAQAASIGRALRGSGLRRIVHSPLERTRETAAIVAGALEEPPSLEVDPSLIEAHFGRYVQGIPYWQLPLRRPLWLLHRAYRGFLPGDESVEAMGRRVLDVALRLVRSHPGEVSACVSHGDPLQAAWVLLDRRRPNALELARKGIARGGVLTVDFDGETPISIAYAPPPVHAVAL